MLRLHTFEYNSVKNEQTTYGYLCTKNDNPSIVLITGKKNATVQ